jgi:hypothetical protein
MTKQTGAMDHQTNHETRGGPHPVFRGEHQREPKVPLVPHILDSDSDDSGGGLLNGSGHNWGYADTANEDAAEQSDPDSDRRPADTYGALASRYKLTIYEKYYQYYRNVMDNRGRPMETWVCDSKYNGWWVRCQWHYQNRLGFMDVWLWVCDERANLTSIRVGHDYYDTADVLETILPYLEYDNLTTGLGSGFIDLGATVKPKTEDWHWDNEHHGWWVECWWEESDHSERIWIDPSSEYV